MLSEDYAIVIQKSGMYKVSFDLEFKSKIEGAKYIRIKIFEICQFID